MKLSTLKRLAGVSIALLIGLVIIGNLANANEGWAFGNNTEEVVEPVEPLRIIVPESLKHNDETLRVEGQIIEVESEENSTVLVHQDLPSKFYDDVDFSSFWAFEFIDQDWTEGSDSHKLLHEDGIYVDDNGLIRRPAPEGELRLEEEDNDDYVVALGSYYKTPHVCGERFLVITSTGTFTIVTGDEQADCDTDDHNMFIWGEGNEARLIEFIVDEDQLNRDVRRMGNVTAAPVEAFKGELISLMKIA